MAASYILFEFTSGTYRAKLRASYEDAFGSGSYKDSDAYLFSESRTTEPPVEPGTIKVNFTFCQKYSLSNDFADPSDPLAITSHASTSFTNYQNYISEGKYSSSEIRTTQYINRTSYVYRISHSTLREIISSSTSTYIYSSSGNTPASITETSFSGSTTEILSSVAIGYLLSETSQSESTFERVDTYNSATLMGTRKTIYSTESSINKIGYTKYNYVSMLSTRPPQISKFAYETSISITSSVCEIEFY